MTDQPQIHLPNGIRPADPQAQQQAAMEAFAYANYAQLGQQLAAINTLLAPLPLAAMLAANKRHQSASVLTLPAQVTPEQAQALAAGLRADEKVITAALNLQRIVAAIATGGA